ncbi:MAG: endonuclease domain-containing protein [Bacteroidetes bacterium]|nr:endonuclease domain-containing protein [Bacteroidota bacterium]
MRKGQIKNVPYLTDTRKELRKNLTPAEAELWKYLQNNKLGRKFRRQYGIEHYITDFCCPKEKLVIELDGEVHNNIVQGGLDEERDERLNELGYKVLRFENKDIFYNADRVISEIINHLKNIK